MTFTQMYERLRKELLRRIERGSLTVSQLARQTGVRQSHLSNFLRERRNLSLEKLDRILAAQHLGAEDLARTQPPSVLSAQGDAVPVVSHTVALFEPYVTPAAAQFLLHLPPGLLPSLHAHPTAMRQKWQRFVAVRIPPAEALAMQPLVLPEALVLLDRHYQSLRDYRPNRPNLYAVRHGAHLRLRYADFQQNRLVLRPLNLAFAVELLELGPEESPNDLLAGRVALISNEL